MILVRNQKWALLMIIHSFLGVTAAFRRWTSTTGPRVAVLSAALIPFAIPAVIAILFLVAVVTNVIMR